MLPLLHESASWDSHYEIEWYVWKCIDAGFCKTPDQIRLCASRWIAGKRKVTPPGTERRKVEAAKKAALIANVPPELSAAIDVVLAESAKAVAQFKAGTEKALNALVGGVIALSLNEGAYAAEIVRAGLLSIDHGQREAAYSLGMGPGYTMRRIVLPQAMKVIIPPMGNETISMLKSTSLLAVVAVAELYTAATQISSQNLRQVELLIVASIWYLAMTTALSIPQYYLERYYGRGTARELPPTPWQQFRGWTGRMSGRWQNRQIARAAAREAVDE